MFIVLTELVQLHNNNQIGILLSLDNYSHNFSNIFIKFFISIGEK